MKQLDMIKAFAVLEGVHLPHFEVIPNTSHMELMNSEFEIYNPIIDLALNCAARDKYEVHTDYLNQSVSIWFRGEFADEMICNAKINHADDVPYAIIECILKSKGLYK